MARSNLGLSGHQKTPGSPPMDNMIIQHRGYMTRNTTEDLVPKAGMHS